MPPSVAQAGHLLRRNLSSFLPASLLGLFWAPFSPEPRLPASALGAPLSSPRIEVTADPQEGTRSLLTGSWASDTRHATPAPTPFLPHRGRPLSARGGRAGGGRSCLPLPSRRPAVPHLLLGVDSVINRLCLQVCLFAYLPFRFLSSSRVLEVHRAQPPRRGENGHGGGHGSLGLCLWATGSGVGSLATPGEWNSTCGLDRQPRLSSQDCCPQFIGKGAQTPATAHDL